MLVAWPYGTWGAVAVVLGIVLGALLVMLPIELARRRRRGAPSPRTRPEAGAQSGASPGDRYEVVRSLGAGSYGEALLARDRFLGREVVVKAIRGGLSADARDALLREARAAARVNHANLVAVYDVTRLGEEDVIVMEYVAGGSLAQRLVRGPLAETVALRVAVGALRGLEALHAAGIVHRDVKPANILLTPDLTAKISDLGVARTPGADAVGPPGGQPGTPRDMSPEQALGREAGPGSDVYSMGAVVYEMLTGRHYLGEGRGHDGPVRHAILETPPALPLHGVSDGVNAAIARAMAKDPAWRYGSAAEFRKALVEAARATRAA